MGILLVTAYNGIAEKGRRQDNSNGYSKYFRQARVRTARLVSLLGLPAASCWWTLHQTASISTHHLRRQGIACVIIE